MNEDYLLEFPSSVSRQTADPPNSDFPDCCQPSPTNSFLLQVTEDQNCLSPNQPTNDETNLTSQNEPTETDNAPNSAFSLSSDGLFPYLNLNPTSRAENEETSPSIPSAGLLNLEDPASQEHIIYRGPQNSNENPNGHRGRQTQIEPDPPQQNTLRFQFFNRDGARRLGASDEEADDLLNRIFEGYVYLVIIYIFSILALKKYMSFYCLLSFAIVTCIGQIIAVLKFSEGNRVLTSRQKIAKYFQIIDWTLLTIFIVVAGCQIQLFRVPLAPFTLPGFVNAILYYFFSNDNSNSLMKKSTISLLKLLFWTQVLLISFKADDIIENWLLVFIELFYTLVFLMAVSVGFFIVAICYLCKNRDSGYFDYDVIGLIWYLLNAFHSWVWGLILLGLLEELRNNEGDSILIHGLVTGLIHSVLLLVFTLIFEKKIIIYLSFTLQQILGSYDCAKENPTFETIKKNIGYLLKISPTYFLMINQHFKMKDKQFPENCKKQIEEVKQRKKSFKSCQELACTRINSENNAPEVNSATVKMQGRQIQCKKSEGKQEKRVESERKRIDSLCYSDDDAQVLGEVQEKALKNQSHEDGEQSCVICCLNTPSAVFMGCGHGGVCHPCAIEAWKNGNNCVFCRQPISEILRVTLLSGVNVAKVIDGTKKSVSVYFAEDIVD